MIYVPGATGDGIAEYSPLWLLVPEAVAAGLMLKKNIMGLCILFGIAAGLSVDIFFLFSRFDVPDIFLKMQASIIAALWCTVISGTASYGFFKE